MNLNRSYPNGPAMKMKPKSYHRPGRGGGDCCCCCGCLECLCGCVFSIIFKLLFTVLVLVGIAVLVLWLVFRPHKVAFRVLDASLSKFNFDGANSTNAAGNLDFDLSLNMTVRNPNERVGFYFDRLEARPLYEGQRLGFKMLTPFYQGHDNTTTLTVRIQGKQWVRLDGSEKVAQYERERKGGVFDIEVKMYLRVRAKVFWGIKSPRIEPEIQCDLKVPLVGGNGGRGATAAFDPTRCDVDF